MDFVFAENEIISLLLGLGILFFYLANLRRIQEFPGYRLLLGSFLAYLLALIFTVLEGVLWRQGFNLLEHLGYLASAALLAGWAAQAARRPGRGAG